MKNETSRAKKFSHFFFIGFFVLALTLAFRLTPEKSLETTTLFKPSVANKIQIGAFVGTNPPTIQKISAFEQLAGRPLYSIMWYEGWDAENQPGFPRSTLSAIATGKQDYVLHLTWEPAVNLKDISNGVYDKYISIYARDIQEWEGEIWFRFAHEMIQDNIFNNGKEFYPWQDQPEEYVKAFRHVHEIFTKMGANNAKFVWCPNNYPVDVNIVKKYFPGTDYVDWLCIDGYNLGNRDGNPGWPDWQWFDDIFASMYHTFTNHPDIFGEKPIMIGEFGSCEASSNELPGQNKAEWINNAFQRIASADYERIKAFHWFHINKECDWRVNSSESAEKSFKKAMKNSRYLAGH